MSAAALLHLPGLRIVVSGLVRVPDRFHRAPPSEAKSVYSPVEEARRAEGHDAAQSLFERVISGRIVEGVCGHEAGNAGETAGGDIEAAGALAQQAAPVAEPAEGALDEPASLQSDEPPLVRALLDDAVAHAVKVAPLLAAPGREGAIADGQAQAGPRLLAVIEGGQRVAILHVGGHDGESEDVAFGIDQRHAFAPDQLLGSVVAAWPAHPDARDAPCVDDHQPWIGPTSATPPLMAR